MSFWVPRASKMGTWRDLADIAKTLKNLIFSLIFEGWRLSRTGSGSFWRLTGALGSAAGWLDGIWGRRVAGGLEAGNGTTPSGG